MLVPRNDINEHTYEFYVKKKMVRRLSVTDRQCYMLININDIQRGGGLSICTAINNFMKLEI
jgi:hypothetical protein